MRKSLRSILIVAIIVSLIVSGISCSKSSPSDLAPPPTTQIDYTSPLITGADWNNMTLSQKEAWVGTALDAMMTGGELKESERQPAIYYVQKLDKVFYEPSNEKKLVSWELTAFTASRPPTSPLEPEEKSSFEKTVDELKKTNPGRMVGENGLIIVLFYNNNSEIPDNGYWDFGIRIINYTTSFAYTSPVYFTIIDDRGNAYNYSASSYSRWGNLVFSSINLPSLAMTNGVLTFRIPPSAKPAKIIYNDGKTPVITMDWIAP